MGRVLHVRLAPQTIHLLRRPVFSLQILSHSFGDNRRNEKSAWVCGYSGFQSLLCLMGLRPCTCSGKLTTLTEKHRVTNGIKYGIISVCISFQCRFSILFWDWPRLLLHYSSLQGRRKKSPDGQAQLLVKLLIIRAQSVLQKFGPWHF